MFVVVAGRRDRAAMHLVARWAGDGAALLTCEDLSAPGWRHFPDDPAASRAVAGGAVVPLAQIRGVVVRRPWIFPAELAHVAAEDRDYVAAEMNAFLLAWLAALPCPVFNAPTAGCLSGPNWGPAQWTQAAARAGLTVRPLTIRIPGPSAPAPAGEAEAQVVATVIDGECLGAHAAAVAAAARRLAAVAGVRWLSVRFSIAEGWPLFLGADLFPDLDEAVAGRLRQAFLSAAP